MISEMEAAPEIASLPEPTERQVRMGLRPCMTSKGASDHGNRWVRPGVEIPLPAHEAENLVSLGYATYV
ncbi:hypothetical protein [Mesorhizobium sp. A556]